MLPVFVILVGIVAILLWLVLTRLAKRIGNAAKKEWDRVVEDTSLESKNNKTMEGNENVNNEEEE